MPLAPFRATCFRSALPPLPSLPLRPPTAGPAPVRSGRAPLLQIALQCAASSQASHPFASFTFVPKAQSFRCSALSRQTRFAGLCRETFAAPASAAARPKLRFGCRCSGRLRNCSSCSAAALASGSGLRFSGASLFRLRSTCPSVPAVARPLRKLRESSSALLRLIPSVRYA